nr:GAF domain-containing protein [Sphingomonas sp. ID1715]
MHDVLAELCALTGMGFAAIACVTEDRWIACQVLDQIDFGLTPGGELDVSTTICDDIRKTQRAIVIDHVREDRNWCTHPTPILYGFQSYVSLPLKLRDGSFFGTLCAIDPQPRLLRQPGMFDELERLAHRAEDILSARIEVDRSTEHV